MTASAEAPAAARAPQKRRPDFFIVGHHKSGTTALYEMLRRHPGVFMPALKEPRYFASDLRAQFEPTRSGRLPQSLDEYLALFDEARPDQLTGEASPSYLRSAIAAGAIAELQPEARIIAILREPASFVRSLHLQLVQEHVEQQKDLRRAVEAEDIVRQGGHLRRYSDHVCYVEQLQRYHVAFPPGQVLVLIYDDFRSDNEASVRRVLRFLELDDGVPIEPVEANPTVRVRSMRLDAIMRKFSAGRGPISRATKATVKALAPGGGGDGSLHAIRRRLVYGAPAPADEAFMLELRRRFKGEVVALSEYLDRDLVTEWGYRSVD